MRTTCVFRSALWATLICAPVTASAQGQNFAASPGAGASEHTTTPPASPVSPPQAKGPYWDGMQAINGGNWAEAEAIFTRNSGQPGGEYPDGSLYWKAYAQNKLGREKDALNTCGQLVHNYPASKWIHECRALEIEVRADLGHPIEPQAEGDDDLKLLALNSLMLMDEPRALADLQEILSGNASEELKQRAISILGQHYSDATYAEIVRIRYVEGDVRIARGEQNEKPAGEPWEQAVADLPLETGFSLATGSNGRAEIELEDASTIYLAENSVLTLNDLHTTSGVPYSEVALLSGTLSLALQSTIYGEAFVLRTPADDITVRYPQRARIRVSSYTDVMAINSQDVSGLKLSGWSPGQVLMGQTATLRQGHLIDGPSAEDPALFAGFDRWVADRLARRAAAMTDVMKAAGLSSPLPGLADMKGQGTFFPCPPYGTCWDPAAAEESQQTAARESSRPLLTGRQPSAHLMKASFEVPRFATAQLMPDLSADPFMDPFSACFPASVRYRLLKDPMTGRARVVDSGLGGGTPAWGWAVCHAGAWVRVPRRHHYVWCAGEKRHHIAPVHWVKSGHRVGFVPMHPFDVKSRPAINRKQEVYAMKDKNGISLERVRFDQTRPIDVLKSPPHEFRTSFLRPLAKADVPHMEARAMRAPLTVAKGPAAKGTLAGPVARPVTPIRFDAKSQSFMISKTEMHGGKSVTVSAPISNHSGSLQSRGGSFAGGHSGSRGGGSSGGGGSRGGGASGGGGARGGASGGGGSAGGGHGGGGGGSSSGSSSSGGGSSGGGGHR